MGKKSGRWPVLLTFAVTAVCVGILCWPIWKIYLAPKTVLSTALTGLYEDLTERTENSPVRLIGKTFDFRLGNTAELTLDTQSSLLGEIRYDVVMGIQWNPRRIQAQGSVLTQGKTVNLAVYLDSEFAAVSSDDLLEGQYFGLTYDSFSRDIRSNSLLSLMIGEIKLQQWESAVKNLQGWMQTPWYIPQITEIDTQSLLAGLMALPAEITQSDGFRVITLRATEAQIASGLDYMQTELPVSAEALGDVECSFWLKNDEISRINVRSDVFSLSADFGGDAAGEDIRLFFRMGEQQLTMGLSTQTQPGLYRETIEISGEENARISYNWNPDNGALTLEVTRNGMTDQLDMTLLPTSEGFSLTCPDGEKLLHMLLGTEDSGDSGLTISFTGGADTVTPEYKNFNNWTLADMATLLGSIGGLLGLEIS